jgi:unsaturated rhamnogalacturonyl hydrolase
VADPEGQRLARAADRLVRHPYECWFYGDSIGFEGLLAASDLLESERWASFAHGFFRAWDARAQPFKELDNTGPGHAMCSCYERTGDELLLGGAAALARFLVDRPRSGGVYASFLRTPLREPYGPVTLPPAERELLGDPGPGVFVDCLHFDPGFFAHLGRLTGDGAYLALGAEQALGYVRLLQDDETGLFYHFWLERTGRPYVLGWSRGQGWALLGLLDVLAELPGDAVERPELTEHARLLAGALVDLQRPDGHWFAVAQDEESGDESSAAAFAAAGFYRGIRLGVLDGERFSVPAARAWDAAWGAVDADGVLTGVSAAVWASTASGHYRHVPRGFVVPWGQGPLLVAALERARYRV